MANYKKILKEFGFKETKKIRCVSFGNLQFVDLLIKREDSGLFRLFLKDSRTKEERMIAQSCYINNIRVEVCGGLKRIFFEIVSEDGAGINIK